MTRAVDDLSVVDLLSEGSVSLLARWTKKTDQEVVDWIRQKFAAELEALDEEACARVDAYLAFLDSSSDESSQEEDSESTESSSEESTSERLVPAKRKASVKLLSSLKMELLRRCLGRRRRQRVKRQPSTKSHLYNVNLFRGHLISWNPA